MRSITTLVCSAVCLLFVPVLAALPATAAEPLTHEALFLMKRVGSPVPSPDGRWVVFSVTEPSYEEDGDVTDLWIVPADGETEPRRLTSGKGGEGDPVFAVPTQFNEYLVLLGVGVRQRGYRFQALVCRVAFPGG